jgi:hypothetical protein
MEFQEAVQQYAGEPLTLQILLDLLKGYKRFYNKDSVHDFTGAVYGVAASKKALSIL